MTTGSSTRSARRRCWLVTWMVLTVQLSSVGTAWRPTRTSASTVSLSNCALHLRCLHAQPDHDPYMSIRSQQHNLIIMSATCIHEHRQFRSIMMHGYISKSFSFWMEIFYFYQFRESTPSFVKLLA